MDVLSFEEIEIKPKKISKFTMQQTIIAACKDKLMSYLSSIDKPYPTSKEIAEKLGLKVKIVDVLLKDISSKEGFNVSKTENYSSKVENDLYKNQTQSPEKEELTLQNLFNFFDEYLPNVFPPLSFGDYEKAANYFSVEQKEIGQLLSSHKTFNSLSRNRELWNKYVANLITLHKDKSYWEIAKITGFTAEYVKKYKSLDLQYEPMSFDEKICFITERFLNHELAKYKAKLVALKEIDEILMPLIEQPNKQAIPIARKLISNRKHKYFRFDLVKIYERLNLLRRANGIMRAPLLHPQSNKIYKEKTMRKNWRELFDNLLKNSQHLHLYSELNVFEELKSYLMSYTKNIACFDLSLPFDYSGFTELLKILDEHANQDKPLPVHVDDLSYILVQAEYIEQNLMSLVNDVTKHARKQNVKIVFISTYKPQKINQNIFYFQISKNWSDGLVSR